MFAVYTNQCYIRKFLNTRKDPDTSYRTPFEAICSVNITKKQKKKEKRHLRIKTKPWNSTCESKPKLCILTANTRHHRTSICESETRRRVCCFFLGWSQGNLRCCSEKEAIPVPHTHSLLRGGWHHRWLIWKLACERRAPCTLIYIFYFLMFVLIMVQHKTTNNDNLYISITTWSLLWYTGRLVDSSNCTVFLFFNIQNV